MFKKLGLILSVVTILLLVACGKSDQDLPHYKMGETDAHATIIYSDKVFVPYCVVSKKDCGEKIGIVDNEESCYVYTYKNLSSDEWIIDMPDTGLMDDPMLWREQNVTDIPEGLESEYAWNNSDETENVNESDESTEITDIAELVRVNGHVYINTGYISSMARCGIMDGEIDSTVDATVVPQEDNQSNFGTGYAYQLIGNMKLLVVIDGADYIFRDYASSDSEIPDEVARFNAQVKEIRSGEILVSYVSSPEEFSHIPNYDYVVSIENPVNDVAVGDIVTIWFGGGIKETDPAQIGAYRIIKSQETKENPATNITKEFFKAFETSNYEAMKDYCTSDCIEKYFHDNDMNGMVWAKLREIGQEERGESGNVYFFVTVEMKTSENSALYPDTETSFYVELQRQENGELLINSFPTGKL